MDKLVYQGAEYIKTKYGWTKNGVVAETSLQTVLNEIYIDSIDTSNYTCDQFIELGDALHKSNSVGHAILYFEKAITIADDNQLKSILPRLTSCYRKQGKPQKAIDLLIYAKNKTGQNIVSPALLISAAAAYCDLEDYPKATACCNRAYAQGVRSSELNSVYGRIRKCERERNL